jgi:hypothetical protein
MGVELRVVRDRAPVQGMRRTPARSDAAVPRIVEPLEVLVAHSIEELDRREWDSVFPDALETWRYLHAIESAKLERCEPVYFAIKSRGHLVAAAPAFVGRRALAEPWRGNTRTQWRRQRGRMLVLGSPLSLDCRIGHAPRASAGERARLVELVLRAAHGEAARARVDGVLARGNETRRGAAPPRFGASAWFSRAPSHGAVAARLSLPPWSLADYLSCLDGPLRGELLRVCARAAAYERDWRVDLDRDLEPMLALCRAAGLDELNGAYFENLLAPGVGAACIVVRQKGRVEGFSLLLRDARAASEKLTVVSRRVKGSFVRALIWLETIRSCLESRVAIYESPSELSVAAARPAELIESTGTFRFSRSKLPK